VVLVDRAIEDLSSSYRCVDGDDRGWVVVGWVLVEALVRPVVIEMALVFAEYGTGVSFVVDQHPVGALGPDAADEAFRVTVRLRGPRRRANDRHRFGGEHRVDDSGKRGVAVTDHIPVRGDPIAGIHHQIETAIDPYAAQVAQLDEVTGIGARCAQEIIAEIGVDMTVFPTAAHLASWARFAPRANQSAGKTKPATTGKGNPWLASTLGEITAVLARSDTFLGERYRRLSRRRGKLRAIVATSNSLLTVIWHLLADPTTGYHDLGADFHDTRYHQRHQHNLIHQLERVTGQKVTLTPRDQPAAA